MKKVVVVLMAVVILASLALTGCASPCQPNLNLSPLNPPALATAELGFTCTFTF